MIVWLDGELVPIEAARLSPLDRGVTVGDGVFETLRVYGGAPFAWRRHADRLEHSAAALDLEIPHRDTLRAAADAVIAANGHHDARLRITATGGEGPPGSSRGGARAHAWIVAWPFTPWEGTADVVIAPWTRNEHSATAGLKTISYAANVRALRYAESRGASEAIFANTAGNLCEATGSNVFWVAGGSVHTPPASAGCLLGVTRALLLELAGDLAIDHHERDLPIGELVGADEIFLSSSTREAQPVAHVEGRTIGDGTSPLTERLAAAFRDLVARELDP